MDDKPNSQKGSDDLQNNMIKKENKTERKRRNSGKAAYVEETGKENVEKESVVKNEDQNRQKDYITIVIDENSSVEEKSEIDLKTERNETKGENSSKNNNIKNKTTGKKNISFLLNKIIGSFNMRQNRDNTALIDLKNAFSHIHPKKVVFLLSACVIAIYLLTGIYIVNPGEQGVIRRFGEVLPQTFGEGIHYRLPYPIDRVQKVNTSEVRRADIGMNLPEHMHQSDMPQSVQLLTGDENIITSEAIVHYKVKDAAKFLYNVNSNDEQLVRSTVESSLVKVMANIAVDDILSTEKVQAQNDILKSAQEMLDNYDAGIQLTAFNIQSINPPSEVAEAFRDVNAAKEDKEKEINNAKGYYNSLIPEARGKANTMITQAESYRTEEMNQASGEAQKFESMLAEYQNNSKIYTQDTTKYRLFLETLEKILPEMKKYILDSSDNSIDLKLMDSNTISWTSGNSQ